jgi:hypothetical protein
MDRRGFLGSLMAITGVVATGVKLPAGREVAKATPKAVALSNDLMSILKECNAVRIEQHMSLHRPLSYEVEYIHCPGSRKCEYTVELEKYTKGMRPVTVNVSQAVNELTRVTVEWM